jgi:glycosyltransferase involved in cell wall biosynthesis
MQLAIVIPVHKEGRRFQAFLGELIGWLTANTWCEVAAHDVCSIIIVDDGSTEPVSISVPSRVDPRVRVHLLRHHTNLGQGAALQTGITYGRNALGCDTFATMDADGQHQPQDLPAMLDALYRQKVDIVFGNRFATETQSQVPALRRLILRGAIAFEALITGLSLQRQRRLPHRAKTVTHGPRHGVQAADGAPPPQVHGGAGEHPLRR